MGSTRRQYVKIAGVGGSIGLTGCMGQGSSGDNSGNDNSGNDNSGGTTIEYISDRGGTREFIEAFISDFEEENPDITVNAEYVTKGVALQERLSQRIAAGNPPDIIFGPSANVYRFAAQGDAIPVTDVIDDLGIENSPVQYEGEDYLVPTMTQVFNYWYRTDHYPNDPSTMSEWLTGAEQVSNNSDMEGFLALSGETNIGTTAGAQLAWSNGVDMITGEPGNMEVVLDQGDNRSKMIEALKWYDDIHEYSLGGGSYGWGDSYNSLAQGNSASAPGLGSDPALTARNNNPEMVENLNANFGPWGEGMGAPEKIWIYRQGHYIHGEAENPEPAKKFIKAFNEGDRIIDWLLEAPMYLLPPSKDMMENERFLENDFISSFEGLWNKYQDNWDSFSTILNTGTDGAANLLGAQVYDQKIPGRMLAEVTINDREPAPVVDEIAEDIRSIEGN